MVLTEIGNGAGGLLEDGAADGRCVFVVHVAEGLAFDGGEFWSSRGWSWRRQHRRACDHLLSCQNHNPARLTFLALIAARSDGFWTIVSTYCNVGARTEIRSGNKHRIFLQTRLEIGSNPKINTPN
jgi:hypothetical protein